MTTQKDFKRLVRARMSKTGEAYTAARAQILKKQFIAAPKPEAKPVKGPAAPPHPSDYGKIAGMSDAAIKKGTGCTWEKWVKAFDHYGAQKMSHAEIAELASKKYKVGSWWSQSVAVGYERIRGLRATGQQRDGSFQASKSRTFNVPVDVLFDAWNDAATRKKWLGAVVKVRKATRPKSVRFDWTDGSIVPVMFAAKGKDRSSAAVEHVKLKSREDAARLKEEWGERFDRLAVLLKTED
jgi:hypothetical protein